MKIIYLATICLLCSLYCKAQVLTILDQQTKEPLEFVNVYNDSIHVFLTSNSAGKVNIDELAEADKVKLSLLGYSPATYSKKELQQVKYLVFLEPSDYSLNQIVINASRWEQGRNELPGKITSISKKEVLLQNPQTTADLLAISGEVFIQKSQQGGGSPMIRGFSANRLLYAVDGVRMNTAIFRSGNLQNVISLDPFAIESTEVLFGPGSVIYGSDAIGGVMAFQTSRPQFSTSDTMLISSSISSRYASSNKEKTVHSDLKFGWKKWALLSSFTYSSYDDLKMGSHGPKEYLRPNYVSRVDNRDVVLKNSDPKIQAPSGYSQYNLMQKIGYKASHNLQIEYGFHYSESTNYDRYDRHLRSKNALPRYGDWYYGPQKWMMNLARINWTKKTLFSDQAAFRLAHQQFEESRISRDFNSLEKEIRVERVNAYSINADFQKSIKRNHLFYGAEFVFNDVISEGFNKNIGTARTEKGAARYPNSSWASAGLYIKNHYKINERFSLHAGARYSRYMLKANFDTSFYPLPFSEASLQNNALTGSAGLIFRPDKKWTFSSQIANAFRAPNVDDMGKVFDSEAGSVVVPNTKLKAEQAFNLELGLAKIFGKKVKIDLSLYHTWLNNAMVRRNFKLNNQDSIVYDGELSQVQAIQNAAKSVVYGIQFGFEAKLPYFLSISSKYSYQKGSEELDNGMTSSSRHAAPWFSISTIHYKRGGWKGQFYVIVNGQIKAKDLNVGEIGKPEIYAKDANGRPYSPSWYSLNLKVSREINKHFSVNIGLENLSDQRYKTYSSGIASAGRNFIASMSLHF